ncbi:MAG TPA: hypothetical protein VEG35_02890 [Burkholderiales bacterium]|nr:hypothetical protein [Burkholderiales bacterium]
MAEKTIKCAECGVLIGPGTGIDIYKHTCACFNLKPCRAEDMIAIAEKLGKEFGERVAANLSAKE